MSGDDVDHSVRRQTPYTPTNNEIEKCLANVQFNSFLSIRQTRSCRSLPIFFWAPRLASKPSKALWLVSCGSTPHVYLCQPSQHGIPLEVEALLKQHPHIAVVTTTTIRTHVILGCVCVYVPCDAWNVIVNNATLPPNNKKTNTKQKNRKLTTSKGARHPSSANRRRVDSV